MAKPARQKHLEDGASQSLRGLIDSLQHVDLMLGECARLLDNAQPLVSGRVQLKFTHGPAGRVRHGEGIAYDIVPRLARAWRKPNGQWYLRWEDKAVSDLAELRPRPAKGRPEYEQAGAVKLALRSIEVLLVRRKQLREHVLMLREAGRVAPVGIAALQQMVHRIHQAEVELKMNWRNDPDAAMALIAEKEARRSTG